jgi:hypothetical protein
MQLFTLPCLIVCHLPQHLYQSIPYTTSTRTPLSTCKNSSLVLPSSEFEVLYCSWQGCPYLGVAAIQFRSIEFRRSATSMPPNASLIAAFAMLANNHETHNSQHRRSATGRIMSSNMSVCIYIFHRKYWHMYYRKLLILTSITEAHNSIRSISKKRCEVLLSESHLPSI